MIPVALAETVQLRIEGMTCGGCVARVEQALRRVPGVEFARINLATEIGTIKAAAGTVPKLLIDAVRSAGYDAELVRAAAIPRRSSEEGSTDRLRVQRQALVWSVGLATPIMATHLLAPVLSSHEHGGHVWPAAIQGLLATALLLSAGGAPILVGGLRAMLFRIGNMDLLISLGVSVAYMAGLFGLLLGTPDHEHFHAAAMILSLVNVGRYLEARAKNEATSAVAVLATHLPATALLETSDGVTEVPLDALRIGDRIRVVQDQVVPVDGRVTLGNAAIDESAITGESLPLTCSPGSDVAAGCVVREGTVTIEATRVGEDSIIGRVARAVADAQSGTTRMQRVADRVATVLVPVVIGLAILTVGMTAIITSAGWAEAIRRGVAVLVIACPCALGLATPVAVFVSTGTAATHGILVADVAALEAAGRIDTMLLDKTGTLTAGRPAVTGIVNLADDESIRGYLRLVASVERFSQHPMAKAIVEYASALNIELADVTDFVSRPGRGVRGRVEGHDVAVGGEAMLRESQVEILGHRESDGDGPTSILAAVDGRIVLSIAVSDPLRDGAPEAIAELRKLGLSVAMLTGDRTESAREVATKTGIADVLVGMSPEDKLAEVRRRRSAGRKVGYAGDGINDAPALLAADVGITFGSATDVAKGAAAITIVHSRLDRLPLLIRLARRSVRIIRQNLFWAFAYNLAALPLAATGHVPPGIAAGAMMFSSLSVVLNSLRLRNRTPRS